jgi:hypothetical protein
VATKIARGARRSTTITPRSLPHYLGPAKYIPEAAQRTSVPGVVTGLAFTPTGGDILFVEATRMPGKGNLIRRHRCHSPCPDPSSRAGAAHGNHTPPATVQEDPAEFPMQAFSPTSPESQPDGLYPDFQRVPIRAIQQPGPSSWKWRLDPQTAPIPQIGSRLRVVVVSPCG